MHLQPDEEHEILNELQAHVEDHVQELMASGVPSDEAIDSALKNLGATNEIANQYYEVHSRGSWYHTALAVIPHLMLALLFGLHLWTAPIWVMVMLAASISITVVGWRMGRPRWTYPWLGYCLVAPIVSWGLAMSAVGYGAWGVITQGVLPLSIPIYAASFIYIAFSVWVVIRFVSRVVRPDWVMASLAVLPVPFLAFWFFYFYNGGDLLQAEAGILEEVDSSATVVFLIIGIATAVFFRIGRRLIRVALLLITAPSLIIIAWISYQGGAGYVAVFLFAVISLAMLLSPALFDMKDPPTDDYRLRSDENTGRFAG